MSHQILTYGVKLDGIRKDLEIVQMRMKFFEAVVAYSCDFIVS